MIRTESAGGVVLNKEGKILVVKQQMNTWSLPKGHVDSGEDTMQTAEREIYEESGIKKLEFIKKLGVYQRKTLQDIDELKTISMFLFTTKQMDLKPIDPKNPKALWVEKGKVADLLTHPKDKEFFLKIVKDL
jgi:ADP-ribose pyrophosphatase YjhB (NUDIX family)